MPKQLTCRPPAAAVGMRVLRLQTSSGRAVELEGSRTVRVTKVVYKTWKSRQGSVQSVVTSEMRPFRKMFVPLVLFWSSSRRCFVDALQKQDSYVLRSALGE